MVSIFCERHCVQSLRRIPLGQIGGQIARGWVGNGHTMQYLKRRLSELPSDLEGIYTSMMR